MGVNFREKPFRNNFHGSKIRGDSGTCAHAYAGTARMTLDACVYDRMTEEKLAR